MTASSCVCIFSALYAPNMGGVETYTANVADALAKKGHRVIVVTLNTHDLEEMVSTGGIELIRLPCHQFLNGRYPIAAKNEAYRHLWSWLQEQHMDYVVVNARFYPHSYAGLALARSKNITPVLIEHGSAHLTMGNPVTDAGVRMVEHVMTAAERHFNATYWAVSRKASAWLTHFGIKSYGELSNSINADEYAHSATTRNFREELGLSAGTFLVAFVGRLVGEKGILELAQAVKDWSAQECVAVVAAGEGPLREELRAYESERFHLVGKLDRNNVAALLTQSDVMCLPSRSEGFATSLLEAAACCTPSIATDVGGTDELLINNEYGTIIPDRSPVTIRAALEHAARQREHLKEQGRNVGQLVRAKYSWEYTAQRVIEACQQAQTNNPT